MASYRTASEARRDFLKLLDETKDVGEVIVTRNGVPAAAIVDFERLQTLKQVARLWQNPEAIRAMRDADEDMRAGRYVKGPKRPSIAELLRRGRKQGLIGD